jgi:hypothetical protein
MNLELVDRLKKIKHDAEDISIGAIPFLKKLEPEYYKQMYFLIEAPWQAWKSPRKLDHTLKWKTDKLDKIVRKYFYIDFVVVVDHLTLSKWHEWGRGGRWSH